MRISASASSHKVRKASTAIPRNFGKSAIVLKIYTQCIAYVYSENTHAMYLQGTVLKAHNPSAWVYSKNTQCICMVYSESIHTMYIQICKVCSENTYTMHLSKNAQCICMALFWKYKQNASVRLYFANAPTVALYGSVLTITGNTHNASDIIITRSTQCQNKIKLMDSKENKTEKKSKVLSDFK